MYSDHYIYPALFYFDPDGISVEFPDLPGCLTCAQTTEVAFKRAREVMGLYIYTMERDGELIPEPTPVSKLHPENDGVVVLITVPRSHEGLEVEWGDHYYYPAVFTYEDGQQIAVVFPDLNVATCGKDDVDALLSARELLRCVVAGLEEDGVSVPAPSRPADIHTEPNEIVVLVDVLAPSV